MVRHHLHSSYNNHRHTPTHLVYQHVIQQSYATISTHPAQPPPYTNSPSVSASYAIRRRQRPCFWNQGMVPTNGNTANLESCTFNIMAWQPSRSFLKKEMEAVDNQHEKDGYTDYMSCRCYLGDRTYTNTMDNTSSQTQ
ncbi:hypothetical protein L2E82_07895 [Cichorium intybus]|uniref:Uncharacterized protein n=1 Tax=Cichorium intybus TaxID=13427 RepID=A0ACB9G613_CICIN|nr:hypothetical protein L2E82_07895 [Cichorium intybus]